MIWKQELAGKIGGSFKRNIFVDIKNRDEVKRVFKKMKYTDCYRSIYAYSNVNDIENSLIYGPLVFDLDMDFKEEGDYERLVEDLNILSGLLYTKLGLNENQYSVYFSGNKGFHIVIAPQVLGVKPMKNLNLYYKDLAMSLKKEMKHDTLDMSIYDKRRVLRENNTINSKSGRYKIETSISEINNISPQEIGRLAQNKRRLGLKKNLKKSVKAYVYLGEIIKDHISPKNECTGKRRDINLVDHLPVTPCIQDLIQNRDIKGERNIRSVSLASVLLQRKLSQEEVFKYMEIWNQNLYDPLSDTELRSTIRSALRMFKDGRVYGCSSLSNFKCSQDCPLYKTR